jgi:O-antigen/teichoic acid export membrane protein
MGSSAILFVDQIVVAATNWIFWLVMTTMIPAANIGSATTVYSLVLLTTTIAQLGLEYPILKETLESRTHIFLTALFIELLLVGLSVPFVILMLDVLYQSTLSEFTWVAIGMLIFFSTSFISRYCLLGIYGAKQVLVIDVVGTAVRFAFGYFLVIAGYGTSAILLAFLLQLGVMTIVSIPMIKQKLGFDLATIMHAKRIFKDAIVNTPAKFSRMLVFNISVILLASFGVNQSEVGVFYIILMISIVAGGLATSISYMMIPASNASRKDLSSDSLRLGLSLTTPLIVALVTAPGYILSLLGEQYTLGTSTLAILAIGILPSSIVMISVSKFNHLGDTRSLILVGTFQIAVFLVGFIILVPSLGIVGCAISMLIAFIASSIVCMRDSERSSLKYLINTCIALGVSASLGFAVNYSLGMSPIIGILISITASIVLIIGLKNTSTREIQSLIGVFARKEKL